MHADGSEPRPLTNDTSQGQVNPLWISESLIAFYFYDYTSEADGIGLVQAQGSPITEITGPYHDFAFYLA